MKCEIVKDLLPNHVDGLNSIETTVEINQHLDWCGDCRAAYEKMREEVPLEIEVKEINFLKKLRARIFRRNIFAAVVACIILLGVLIGFAKSYQVPIPYDHVRMTVELIQEAVFYTDDGYKWVGMDTLDNGYFYSDYFPLADDIPEPEFIRDTLYISWHSFGRVSVNYVGRDIVRDGESVRVVYYRHTKTPWNILFYDYDLTSYQDRGRVTGTGIYGERFQSAEREPRRIEIYYLPIRNIIGLNSVSDEDFDAERLNAWLVWSGEN